MKNFIELMLCVFVLVGSYAFTGDIVEFLMKLNF